MLNILSPLAAAAAAPSPGADDALSRSLLDASADCIKVVGLDGELQYMNVNGLCLMEIDDFDSVRGRPWPELWPDEHRLVIEEAMASARGGAVARFCADCPTAKGALKSWEVVVSPIMGEDGRPARLVSVSRDVTERNRLDEQRDLLARELAHRIKNMFAVVDGVVGLSARAAPEAKGFADPLRRRLIDLGRAIAYVTPAEFGGAAGGEHTLHGLLQVLLAPYGPGDAGACRVSVAGHDAEVGRTATTAVALFANELATNALKYGSLGVPEGRVQVTTRADGEMLELVWEEHGAGVPEPRALGRTEGFGTTLMDNAVVRQLRGSLSREWGPGGLVVRMTLPLAILAR